jgi:23S rRNA pseudouridine2457 synthase
MKSPYYACLYKPYLMITGFTGAERTLAECGDFPKDVYPVGRLDKDSEGLLILTNDSALKNRLLEPRNLHEREYLAQVEGIPTTETLNQLADGVTIRIDKRDYLTRPAKARLLQQLPELPERHPPIRYRKSVPDSWISLTLTEGKNRQVRRMTAAVNLPTLRLVRWRIGSMTVAGLQPGQVRELTRTEAYNLLLGSK